MTTTNTPKIEFIQQHLPALDSGEYQITVEQTIRSKTSGKIPQQTFSRTMDFAVVGEQFGPLTPEDVSAVFPPEGSLGEHSNVLPHIILKRSTLPWERAPDTHNVDPWLVLLLFEESEKPEPISLTLKELKNTPSSTAKFPEFEKETGQHDEDQVMVIDVPKELLGKILPTKAELAYIAHVRQNKDAAGNPNGDQLATIVGSRLPKKGAISTVHLVSVEDRYDDDGNFNYQRAQPTDLIRLVSLKSWSFACVDSQQNFSQMLQALNRNPNTLRLTNTGQTDLDTYLSNGYIACPHELREGEKTVSWYRGPFTPGENSDRLTEPVMTPDSLLRYNSSTGMFDSSYSAAWQLGRLLMLENQRLAIELFNWKRQHAQNIQKLRQIEQQILHLPLSGQTPNDAIAMPDALATWFRDLELLKGVPFNYLVPDERLLPKESIRFFWVDAYWVDCLQDGAFSLGRVTAADQTTDGNNTSISQQNEKITGFLMRSDIVAGWPHLEVDAYDSIIEGKKFAPTQNKLTQLRLERLSPDILICLFDGEIKTVDVHQKPEAMHFGLDPKLANQAQYTKGIRDLQGQEIKDKLITINWRNEVEGVVDLHDLAGKIEEMLYPDRSNTPTSAFTSAQFALTMIEGVQKIRFGFEEG